MSRIAREFPGDSTRWTPPLPRRDKERAEPTRLPEPWFATDDRATDLPAHMERWNAEARGDAK